MHEKESFSEALSLPVAVCVDRRTPRSFILCLLHSSQRTSRCFFFLSFFLPAFFSLPTVGQSVWELLTWPFLFHYATRKMELKASYHVYEILTYILQRMYLSHPFHYILNALRLRRLSISFFFTSTTYWLSKFRTNMMAFSRTRKPINILRVFFTLFCWYCHIIQLTTLFRLP